MRTIKFRAWHKEEKRMYYVGGFHHILEAYYTEPERQFEPDIQKVYLLEDSPRTCQKVWQYPADEVELMEYTGLKDKDGEEIYEGYIVEYLDNTSQGLVKKTTVIRDIRHLPDFSCSKWEKVIGNIYENGDLLEDK